MQETIRIADGAFEERLGYKFSTRELLERALTHSSAVPELRAAGAEEAVSALLPRDNERLEFLGDAVLELLTSEYLLATFPEWSEGQLSKSRARIVNAHSLEAAARRLRLGEHLRLGRGEEKTGGRDKQTLQMLPESDRKSTRLNSSHQIISYAVFCFKKKKIY